MIRLQIKKLIASMAKRKIKLLLFFLLSMIVFFYALTQHYRKWNNLAVRSAHQRFFALDVLLEVQKLQIRFKEDHGHFAKTIDELVEIGDEISIELQENSKDTKEYYYQIIHSSDQGFLAEARYHGNVFSGEVIWQIREMGQPVHVKASKD
jgi:hypothetical protein